MRTVSTLLAALLLILAACGPKSTPARGESPTPAEYAENKSDAQPAPEASSPSSAKNEATKPDAAPKRPLEPEHGSTQLPKLWDFYATWCPPCRTQAPIIAELEREFHGRIEISSIDVDQNRELAQRFNVQAIPTLVFLDAAGNELARNVGLMQKDEILAKFRSLGFLQ